MPISSCRYWDYLHAVGLYGLVALESQTYELVVLAQYLGGRAGEVEPYLRNAGSQVIDTECHLFGQVCLAFPYDPAQAGIDESELVARGADGDNPFQPEIPFLVRFEKGQNKSARSGVDVYGNVVAGFLVIAVECLVERLDVVVQSGPGNPFDGNNTDGVFVAQFQRLLGVEGGLVESERNLAQLDLPQLGKLFPHNLVSCRDDEVGLVGRLFLGQTFLAPAQPCRHAAQHTSLGRADGHSAAFPLLLFGGVPQIGQNVDAFGVHHRYAGILCLVDVVDVDGIVHQPGGILVHVGGNECGQIQPGLCLGKGFVLDHLVGNLRRGGRFGNTVDGGRLQHFVGTVNGALGVA